MRVTCTNPYIWFDVYHDGLDHYFVAWLMHDRKIEAHYYGEDWLDHYCRFIDTVLAEAKGG